MATQRRGRSVKRTQDSFQQLLAMDRRGQSAGSQGRAYSDAFALPTGGRSVAEYKAAGGLRAGSRKLPSGGDRFTQPRDHRYIPGLQEKLGAKEIRASGPPRGNPRNPVTRARNDMRLGSSIQPVRADSGPAVTSQGVARPRPKPQEIVSGQYDERGPRGRPDHVITKAKKQAPRQQPRTSRRPVRRAPARPVRGGGGGARRQQTAASGSMARIAARRRARGG
ncbi:hypothetical protein LCGC14_0761460 [marine sediment metagenome]|uniref:Uncharacterized protein n=1 Tax=marine sediment metagenome TaxID=412755 RepID=A0A0F9SL04_9ZZZZ